MKTYELTYIISSGISAEEAEALAKEIDSFIQSKEGVILKSENPIARILSYQIKKQASGFFVISEFQVEPDKISEIKEKLEKDTNILRHFILTKKPAKIQKARRTRKIFLAPEIETITAVKKDRPSFAKASENKEKVELNDIEKKLDEILGE
jgi:ribosomal protein S6